MEKINTSYAAEENNLEEELNRLPKDKKEKLLEKWEHAGIEDDFIFGRVMEDKQLCMHLLRIIFPQMDIVDITYPDTQLTIDLDRFAKGVRIDVFVKDDKNTVYNIEMQIRNTKVLPKRTRYYQGLIDLKLLNSGESYNGLNDSYIVFICPFDLFGEGRYVYTFENRCVENPGIYMGDGARKVFLNVNGYRGEISEGLDAFFKFVAGREVSDDFTSLLNERIRFVKAAREVKEVYLRMNINSVIERAEAREEGWAEGLEAGRKAGLEAGRAEGLEEGKAEGRKEGRAEGRKEGRAEGRKEGRAEGLEEGKKAGENRLASLLVKLSEDGHIEESRAILFDMELRQKLYRKYGL